MTEAVRRVVAEVYAQVAAPEWAAPNLDGLADVLRDLSWLAPGRVDVTMPDLRGLGVSDRAAVLRVLWRAASDGGGPQRPLRILIEAQPSA